MKKQTKHLLLILLALGLLTACKQGEGPLEVYAAPMQKDMNILHCRNSADRQCRNEVLE